MIKRLLIAASVMLMIIGAARADMIVSGPTFIQTGGPGFAINLNSNVVPADQPLIISGVLTSDMLFFQMRSSESEAGFDLEINFYEDSDKSGAIEVTDTLIGTFSQVSFSPNPTASWEWKLDVTTAHANNNLVGALIAAGVPGGSGNDAHRQDNGQESVGFATMSAVPEPSAFLYGGVVAAIAGLGYRRRQQSVA